MDDKNTENTNIESTQNTFLKMKQWHTIEAAASLIVSGDVVKGQNWRDNAEIQETYKLLRDKAFNAFRYSKLKISVHEAIELLENNPYLSEAMRKYPDLTRKDLVIAVERFFGRELAVSHTALRDIIKCDNWHDILEVEINEFPKREFLSTTCRSLLDDVCKACRDSESIIKKDKVIKLIEDHFYMDLTIKRYPDINHRHFETMIERFFTKAQSGFTRTFNELSQGLNNEYNLAKSCSGIMDFERDIEYTPEYIKTAMEVSLVIEALIKDADKFYLDPCFYPEGEAEPDYSCFYPVSLKPDTAKGYFEVRAEGIKTWLKHGFKEEIHDKFFNPAPEKPKIEITDTPKSFVPSATLQKTSRQIQ